MLHFGLVIYLFCIRKNAAQKLMNPPEIMRLLLFLFYGIIRPCLLSETSFNYYLKDHLQILLKILRKFKQTSIPTKIIRSSLPLFLFYSIIMPCLLSETTISCKIFETNSSFYVK